MTKSESKRILVQAFRVGTKKQRANLLSAHDKRKRILCEDYGGQYTDDAGGA